MSLSKWECGEPGCKSTAVGAGGAIGLRAIGWYFAPPPRDPRDDSRDMREVLDSVWRALAAPNTLRCPAHRPDKVPCDDYALRETEPEEAAQIGKPCASCAGEHEANELQQVIAERLGIDLAPPPLRKGQTTRAPRAKTSRGVERQVLGEFVAWCRTDKPANVVLSDAVESFLVRGTVSS